MCPDDNVIQYSYPIYPIYRFKMNRTDDVQSSTKVKRRKTILETNRKRTQPSRGMLNARERAPCPGRLAAIIQTPGRGWRRIVRGGQPGSTGYHLDIRATTERATKGDRGGGGGTR